MNSLSRPMIRPVSPKEVKCRHRARRVGMFFDTLTNVFAVLSAVILMWLLVSWVDFCAHDLSRSYDFWLGGANLVRIICDI